MRSVGKLDDNRENGGSYIKNEHWHTWIVYTKFIDSTVNKCEIVTLYGIK